MRGQRIGGLLLVAGSAGFGLKVLSTTLGASTTLGTALLTVPGAIYAGSMVLLGLGAAILAVDRPSLRLANLARVGLAIMAVSLFGLAYYEVNPVQGDPLSSWGTILLYLCFPLGQIVVGLALLGERRLGRVLGVLFVGALPAMVLFQQLQGPAAAPGDVTSQATTGGAGLLVGAVAIAVGWAWLGVLVFRRTAGGTDATVAEPVTSSALPLTPPRGWAWRMPRGRLPS